MTRKDYRVIAQALRDAYDIGTSGIGIESNHYWDRMRQYETTVLEMANALHSVSGLDRNGNPSFNIELFLQVAGYSRRPDGSRYPI